MANITALPSGKFRAQIRRAGVPTMSNTFTTKRKAEEWAASMDKGITDGVIQDKIEAIRKDALVPTLRDALDLYVRTGRENRKSKETRRAKTLCARADIGGLKLTAIYPGTIAAFRDTRSKEKNRFGETLSGNTVRLEIALISAMFTWYLEKRGTAKEIPGLEYNPALSVIKPTVPKPRDRRLTEKEELALLKAAKNYSNPEAYALILFGIETAARLSEIRTVEWRYIDLDRGVAKFPDTKNGSGREIPLSDITVNALRELYKLKTDAYPFHYTDGGWHTVWYTILRRAGINNKDLHFHDLRHEATTRLFERHNLTIMEAAAVTGHKDLKMLKRYTHLKADDIRKKMTGKGGGVVSPKDRLQSLKEMLDEKLISKKDYQEKSKAILAEL